VRIAPLMSPRPLQVPAVPEEEAGVQVACSAPRLQHPLVPLRFSSPCEHDPTPARAVQHKEPHRGVHGDVRGAELAQAMYLT
jgi:hypothetical protein